RPVFRAAGIRGAVTLGVVGVTLAPFGPAFERVAPLGVRRLRQELRLVREVEERGRIDRLEHEAEQLPLAVQGVAQRHQVDLQRAFARLGYQGEAAARR